MTDTSQQPAVTVDGPQAPATSNPHGIQGLGGPGPVGSMQPVRLQNIGEGRVRAWNVASGYDYAEGPRADVLAWLAGDDAFAPGWQVGF